MQSIYKTKWAEAYPEAFSEIRDVYVLDKEESRLVWEGYIGLEELGCGFYPGSSWVNKVDFEVVGYVIASDDSGGDSMRFVEVISDFAEWDIKEDLLYLVSPDIVFYFGLMAFKDHWDVILHELDFESALLISRHGGACFRFTTFGQILCARGPVVNSKLNADIETIINRYPK